MKVALALLALVAYASASRYAYHGKYEDKCDKDGLYYKDTKSFVFCSNGNSYVQPCAPGTRNSGYDRYSYGGYYTHADFCDVNLNDYGYGAVHGHYAARPYYGYGYGRPYGYYGPYGPY